MMNRPREAHAKRERYLWNCDVRDECAFLCAGKSTIASLLLSLYSPTSGSIRLRDVDIGGINPTWLRKNIGVVAQEPVLFSASIADNIRWGRNWRITWIRFFRVFASGQLKFYPICFCLVMGRKPFASTSLKLQRKPTFMDLFPTSRTVMTRSWEKGIYWHAANRCATCTLRCIAVNFRLVLHISPDRL